MTVMALAIARAREDDCDALEGSPVYDSIGERVGWVGQVMDESGHPCEHMGMDDEGYTSCWSASEISRLKAENEKLTKQCSRLFDKTLEMADECERLKESLTESEQDVSMAWDRARKADVENARLREVVDRLERHALANVPTSGLKETKARLNQMRRLCWLEERW